jgi:hypothetical protein
MNGWGGKHVKSLLQGLSLSAYYIGCNNGPLSSNSGITSGTTNMEDGLKKEDSEVWN